MRCPECDKELPDYATFCPYCGLALDEKDDTKTGFILGYATFGKRFAAGIIDIFFLSLFLGLITLFTGFRISSIATLVLSWLYFSYMESSIKQGTVGKNFLGIKVADERLQRINFGRASLRFLGKLLTVLTLGIGFFMFPRTKQKQALHDKLVKTVVLYENKYNKEQVEDMPRY